MASYAALRQKGIKKYNFVPGKGYQRNVAPAPTEDPTEDELAEKDKNPLNPDIDAEDPNDPGGGGGTPPTDVDGVPTWFSETVRKAIENPRPAGSIGPATWKASVEEDNNVPPVGVDVPDDLNTDDDNPPPGGGTDDDDDNQPDPATIATIGAAIITSNFNLGRTVQVAIEGLIARIIGLFGMGGNKQDNDQSVEVIINNNLPDPKTDNPSIPDILGKVRDIVGDILGTVSNTDALIEAIRTIGNTPGEDLKRYLDQAFPGTTPWEQLGSSAKPPEVESANIQANTSRHITSMQNLTQLRMEAMRQIGSLATQYAAAQHYDKGAVEEARQWLEDLMAGRSPRLATVGYGDPGAQAAVNPNDRTRTGRIGDASLANINAQTAQAGAETVLAGAKTELTGAQTGLAGTQKQVAVRQQGLILSQQKEIEARIRRIKTQNDLETVQIAINTQRLSIERALLRVRQEGLELEGEKLDFTKRSGEQLTWFLDQVEKAADTNQLGKILAKVDTFEEGALAALLGANNIVGILTRILSAAKLK